MVPTNTQAFAKTLLGSIITGKYTPIDLRQFVHLCFKLALPLVRKKIAAGKLRPEFIRLSESDLVFDCLAELFQRDTDGRFVVLETYFDPDAFGVLGKAETLIELRTLVFHVVSRGFIRLYSETDPVLGKVLRNLKLAVQKTGLFRMEERFGETYLVPRSIPLKSSRPFVPPDRIEQAFFRETLVNDSVVTMVKTLYRLLREEPAYRREVPMMTAALIFRKVYSLSWEAEWQQAGGVDINEGEASLTREEFGRLADKICGNIRIRMVKGNNRDRRFVDLYLTVLKEILLDEFGSPENDGFTYYERLKALIPELTRADYLRKHRKKVEYLAKIAKKRMAEELKKSIVGRRTGM